jgi:hypothetical protein
VFSITTASAPPPIGFLAYYLRVPNAPLLEGGLNTPLVNLEYTYEALRPTLPIPELIPAPDTLVRKSKAFPLA